MNKLYDDPDQLETFSCTHNDSYKKASKRVLVQKPILRDHFLHFSRT